MWLVATILNSTALDSCQILCTDIFFCPLCQHLIPFLCHNFVWILSPSRPPPIALFIWLQTRMPHLLGFLSGLSIVTTEIWNLISLPSFTPWINPHYVHTYKWTDIYTSFFVSDGTVAMVFLLCMREVEKPSTCWIPCCWCLWYGSPPSKHIHRSWEQQMCTCYLNLKEKKNPSSQAFLSSP